MPPLNLDPWEIPEGLVDSPNGPAHALHTIPWIDGSSKFLFRLVKVSTEDWLVFAQLESSPDRGNWVVCSGDYCSPLESQFEGYRCIWNQGLQEFFVREPEITSQEYLDSIIQTLCQASSRLCLGRLIITDVDDNKRYCLLMPGGIGLWINWSSLQAISRFDLPINIKADPRSEVRIVD